MQELQRFLTVIISEKRKFKEIYYTTRSKTFKDEVKKLVVTTISIQRITEELLTLWRKKKLARSVLQDRKAQLTVTGWIKGLPKRVQDFKEKSKTLEGDHLMRYYQVIAEYLDSIAETLTKWLEDITGLDELPSVPKE